MCPKDGSQVLGIHVSSNDFPAEVATSVAETVEKFTPLRSKFSTCWVKKDEFFVVTIGWTFIDAISSYTYKYFIIQHASSARARNIFTVVDTPMEDMGDIFETLFYKRRLIYRDYIDNQDRQKDSNNEYRFEWIESSVEDSSIIEPQYEKLVNSVGERAVEARLEHLDCSLGYVTHEESGELVGYNWVLHPSSEPIWHDKYRTEVDEALVFHVYIFEEYRRKGVFSKLYSGTKRKISDKLVDKIVLIVEASNEPMKNASNKFGWTQDGTNNLLKFFGINMLVVLQSGLDFAAGTLN